MDDNPGESGISRKPPVRLKCFCGNLSLGSLVPSDRREFAFESLKRQLDKKA